MVVYYVPNISANLFSIVSATKNGLTVQYDNDTVKFVHDNKVVLQGYREDTVYLIDLVIVTNGKASAYVARTIEDWHQRFGDRKSVV